MRRGRTLICMRSKSVRIDAATHEALEHLAAELLDERWKQG
jgi:hypothetical protein